MKPGAVCEDVDRGVLAFIRRAGYADWVRHRTGHGKGLEEHEPPYAAAGDRTVMEPGMAFSSEPGLYRDGFAGFRHSDIVLITETGSEAITKYPKDLESLIL
jgi:Xaa-Pro dipeptidase